MSRLNGGQPAIPNPNIQKEKAIKEWAQARGLKVAKGPCLHRLLGQQCDGGHARDHWLDHGKFFVSNGKPALLVGQPYDLHPEHLKALVDEAERHDLGLQISGGPSWHYPGGVVTVFLWRRDVIDF